MVNNYVKMGVMPAPVKKKYSRTHIAHLIVICILKSAIPIDSIRRYIKDELLFESEEKFYDHFCDLYGQINSSVSESAVKIPEAFKQPEEMLKHTVLYFALRAQAEQALASEALELLLGTEKKEKPERK